MPKFDNNTETPEVATPPRPQCLSYSHRQVLEEDQSRRVTPALVNSYRRHELGPRPVHNQDDLISSNFKGVHSLVPGTGWAQINGRDELPIPEKVNLDVEYLESHSVILDAKIILLTAARVLRSSDVSH